VSVFECVLFCVYGVCSCVLVDFCLWGGSVKFFSCVAVVVCVLF